MSGSGGDDSNLVPIPGGDGNYYVQAALLGEVLSLYHHALIDAARTDSPDFVPTEWLARLAEDAEPTVDELCRAGMWEVFINGYRVLDSAAVERAVQNVRRAPEARIDCEKLGHMPTAHWGLLTDDGISPMCMRCYDYLEA